MIAGLLKALRPKKVPPRLNDHVTVFSSPEMISAYVERLDTTTLPFAIDAMHVIGLVPPHAGSEYVVLDDACGTGAAVEYVITQFKLAGVHLDITATDYSAVMMDQVAIRRERLNWGEHVKTALMDAQALRFPNNTFTHVLLTFGIMLIPNYDLALKSIHRVLQQNGQVAITSWNSHGHWDYLVRAARQVFQNPLYPPPRFFDKKWLSGEYIAKLLSRRGFRDVQIHVRTHMWTWSSKKSFIEFVGRNKAPAVQLYMAGWSPQQKENVVETLGELLDKEFPDKDRFSVPMVANIVVGRKPYRN